MTIEEISKLDAACRQLDTAIELWFRESDPVSIHTLACSAHQIIHDTIRHRGGQAFLHSPYIRREFRKRAEGYFRRSYSFLKHADRDPETSIEFDTSAPEGFILASVVELGQLGIGPNVLRFGFAIYFGFHSPDLFTKKFFQDFHLDRFPKVNLPRPIFLEKLRQVSPILERHLETFDVLSRNRRARQNAKNSN